MAAFVSLSGELFSIDTIQTVWYVLLSVTSEQFRDRRSTNTLLERGTDSRCVYTMAETYTIGFNIYGTEKNRE